MECIRTSKWYRYKTKKIQVVLSYSHMIIMETGSAMVRDIMTNFCLNVPKNA